jgi:hypothetical protein
MWHAGQHRRLHRSHDFAGFGANHGEAKNLILPLAHEPL